MGVKSGTLRLVTIGVLLAALPQGVSLQSAPRRQVGEQPIRYEVVERHPHDPSAFTQGLYYEDGFLFESTGRHGQSSLRKVDPSTGRPVQQLNLGDQFFGEGIAALGSYIYQLTWLSGLAFVYDKSIFEEIRRVPYQGEGWGLTHDGEHLVISDGSATLRFVDPASFRDTRKLLVHDGAGPVSRLNELEYVRGQIFANIWHANRIVRISPQSGRVTGELDLRGLAAEITASDPEAVLNGIAYDPESDRLFVTGKLWPTLFELRLLPKGD